MGSSPNYSLAGDDPIWLFFFFLIYLYKLRRKRKVKWDHLQLMNSSEIVTQIIMLRSSIVEAEATVNTPRRFVPSLRANSERMCLLCTIETRALPVTLISPLPRMDLRMLQPFTPSRVATDLWHLITRVNSWSLSARWWRHNNLTLSKRVMISKFCPNPAELWVTGSKVYKNLGWQCQKERSRLERKLNC